MNREVVQKSNRLWLLITGSIILSLLIQFLSVVNVSAANAFIDPNGDGSNAGWTVQPSGTAYTTVDEATRQPTVPTTTDYVQSAANNNANLFLQMGTIANVATVSSITVWAYHNDGANGVITFALYDATESTNYGSANFAQRTTSGWNSVTISGLSLTQAQLDGLRFRFNTTKSGGGGPATIYLYATYADVTYTSSGSLSVGIVDGAGSPVGSPSLAMSTKQTSLDCQSGGNASTGTLGVSAQRIRLTNTTANGNWTVSMAATSGNTALWTSGGNQYDFNDPSGGTAGCSDGGDADSRAGQLSVNPSAGTITPQGGCSSSGVTRGSFTTFNQGTTDSITLLTGVSSQTSCYYELTDVALSQTIPAETPASGTAYALSMTITAVAN
jgi:hypothetical protein